MQQKIDLEQLCADKGLRITEQRRVIARVLSESDDHPDVELLHERASSIDPKISIATVYRTVRLAASAECARPAQKRLLIRTQAGLGPLGRIDGLPVSQLPPGLASLSGELRERQVAIGPLALFQGS